MKGKTALILMLIFLILFAGIYFIDIKRSEIQSRRAELEMRLFNIPIDSVYSYSIKNPKSETVLRQESGKWVITSPILSLADSDAVVVKLASILGTKIERKIHTPVSDLSGYGLAEPRGIFQFTTIDNKTFQLMIGNENPTSDFLYVQIDGSVNVALVSKSVWNLVNIEPFDLRDRKLMHINPLEVRRIVISRSDLVTILEKQEDIWWLVQPIRSPVNTSNVLLFLNRLANARIYEFVDESPTDVSLYGLDSAQLRIDLFSGSENQPMTLIIGNSVDKDFELVYACNRSRNPVFLLDKWLADNLEKSAVAFRDSTAFLPEHQL